MQRGRRFRAARPRSNLDDCHYSNRFPFRCDFYGQFGYNGMLATIGLPQTRGECSYDGSTITWEIVNTIPTDLGPFTAKIRTTPRGSGGGWRVQIEVSDGGGQLLIEWQWDAFHSVCCFATEWLFGVLPNRVAATGLFDGYENVWIVPAAYPD